MCCMAWPHGLAKARVFPSVDLLTWLHPPPPPSQRPALAMTARCRTITALVSFAAFARLASAAETAALSNLSVRTAMAANQTLIVGGVLSGGAKNILVRAGGPALTKFGLSGMADPRLALYTTGSTPIASNDNWTATLAPTFTSVGAFGFDPGSRDAALVQSLNGAFTVQATGDTAGTLLVEAYDVAGGVAARMINVSARNRVGTGDDVLIAGFNISGTGTKTLLIRGVGPGLAAFGVPGTLADPSLKLFDSKGAVLATNDNWNNTLAPTFSSVGAFVLPANSNDAAMIVNLSPGSYSVQVAGADGGTGDGIVEIYEIADPLAEARLPDRTSSRSQVHLGFPRISQALKATGDVRIKVIFVDFSDAVASRTPQSVFGLISPGSENLWKAVSYGKMNPTLDPVFTWLRMSKPSGQYGWSSLTAAAHKAYIQEALNLAVAAGIDFSASDTISVMANPDATALTNGPTYIAGGLTASGKTFSVAITSGRDLLTWGYKWLNHEGGHMLGLADLYGFTAPAHRFVGEFSLMGLISGAAPEYLGWERWLLGWLDDDQVIAAERGTTTFALTPLETAGGKKMIVVPTGATTAVVVESRRPLGLDRALTKSGPLVYFIDTSIATGNGVVKVLPIDETDTRKLTAPLSVGQTLTFNSVAVKYVSGDASTVNVEVTRP